MQSEPSGLRPEPATAPTPLTHSTRRRSRFAFRLGLGLSLLLLAAGLVRVLALQGLWRPIRIASSSMADRLPGPHFEVTCPECRFVYRCGFDQLPGDDHLVCPNCGALTFRRESAVSRPGARILVDRWPYWRRGPRRWEIAAMQSPEVPGAFAVKRIVGLPGERLSIRNGNLFANGVLLRKSLDEFRELAVVVHDDRYRPARLPRRWQPVDDRSRWSAEEEEYVFQAAETPAAQSAWDWLAYHHWPGYSSYPGRRTEEVPVQDPYAYNQKLSRSLHPVHDLLVRVVLSGSSSTDCRVEFAQTRVGIEITRTERQIRVFQGDELLAEQPLPAEAVASERLWEVGVFDQQAVVALQGRAMLVVTLPSPGAVGREPAHAGEDEPQAGIRLGARGGELRVRSPVVLRDLYWLDPLRTGQPWEARQPLGNQEYFVLGDNVPLSRDSRHWPPGEVQRTDLIGLVRLWDQ